MKRKFLKTIITSMVALIIPLGLATTAFAEGTTTDQTVINGGTPEQSDISFTSTNSYSISIPRTYALGTITKSFSDNYLYQRGTVTIDALLSTGSDIQVSVTAAAGNLTNGEATVPFKLFPNTYPATEKSSFDNNALTTETATLTLTSPSTTATKDYYVGINRSTITALGEYNGNFTFTVTPNLV